MRPDGSDNAGVRAFVCLSVTHLTKAGQSSLGSSSPASKEELLTSCPVPAGPENPLQGGPGPPASLLGLLKCVTTQDTDLALHIAASAPFLQELRLLAWRRARPSLQGAGAGVRGQVP